MFNHPRRLLLLVPLALLGAALLVRARLPLSASAAEVEPYPTPSASDNMVTAPLPPSKPRATTPKQKPQPPVSTDKWLWWVGESADYLNVDTHDWTRKTKGYETGLKDGEGITIRNRQMMRALMHAFRNNSFFGQPDKDHLSPVTNIVTITVSQKGKIDQEELLLYQRKNHLYLDRYHDAAVVNVPSVARFLRTLRGAVTKGRRKQWGYSLHYFGE